MPDAPRIPFLARDAQSTEGHEYCPNAMPDVRSEGPRACSPCPPRRRPLLRISRPPEMGRAGVKGDDRLEAGQIARLAHDHLDRDRLTDSNRRGGVETQRSERRSSRAHHEAACRYQRQKNQDGEDRSSCSRGGGDRRREQGIDPDLLTGVLGRQDAAGWLGYVSPERWVSGGRVWAVPHRTIVLTTQEHQYFSIRSGAG